VEGTPTKQIDLTGNPGPGNEQDQTLTFSITDISGLHGTLYTNQAGTVLLDTDTWTATADAANSFTVSVFYKPAADYNMGDGAAGFSYSVKDNGQSGSPLVDDFKTATGTVTLQVTPVNDAPVAQNVSSSGNEDTVFQLLTATGWNAAFQDLKDAANGPQGEASELLITNVANLHGQLTYGAGGPAVGTTIDWADLANVYYKGDLNYYGPASFDFKVKDAGGGTDTSENVGSMSITVNAVNDAPVNTVPATQSVLAAQTLTFSTANGNAISVLDVDSGIVKMTLSVTNGNLTLSRLTDLTFLAGDGYQDTFMTIQGTWTAINAALNGMVFKPTVLLGTAGICITTDDLSGTPQATDTDSVAINVLGRRVR
jgi:large repetitive protein